MVESIEYDLIICGSGLAGLRAAISATQKAPKIKIAVISKVQVMRSHSVSAEGGTAAVIADDEGDSIESHVYDTVKGSDFLADQDVAERLCMEILGRYTSLTSGGCPGRAERTAGSTSARLAGTAMPGPRTRRTRWDFTRCRPCTTRARRMRT
ncbi:succinate dehydrogenase, flavoprotein subunit A [Cenarchaeum symbiosum A]|uniref:Succinate dehydrogenase, flavoprotein subunit A n=1 Tax=Cenarchaeum symbiosum (strain A) TaxID=414004 RepID=A0RYA3_CENSY|nr:succinate dehydrogenase, flavoprotein subunit A [Cenarchaeum symbiosum A]